MDKIKIGSTYGYTNFITQQEQQDLLNWVQEHQHRFQDNGFGRRYGVVQSILKEPYNLIEQLRHRVIKLEDIKDFKREPIFQDYVGINSVGGAIHLHTDPNQPPYIHTRFNIILSYPERGGESIYGNDVNSLQERLMWKCVAGKVKHGSIPVVSGKPRITLSLGFLIND